MTEATLSDLAGKDWSELQVFNKESLDKVSDICNTLSGGTFVLIEILIYIIFLIPFVISIAYKDSAYFAIQNVTLCNNNIPTSNSRFFNILSIVGGVLILIRIIAAKTFYNLGEKTRTLADLVLGLILWVLFLIQMIMAISVRNNVHNTAKCSSADAEATKQINQAKEFSTKLVLVTVGGFIFTTAFTCFNVFQYYKLPGEIQLEETKQFNLIKTTDKAKLNPSGQTIKDLAETNSALNGAEALEVSGITP